MGPSARWLLLHVKWNWLSIQYKVGWSYLRNLIISLSIMVLKILILMFDKINMSKWECCMDGIDMILRTLVMGLNGIDAIFKLVTLHVLDDVSNLNQSIWVWLIPQGFSGIVILDVGWSNHMYWDIEEKLLSSLSSSMLSWMWIQYIIPLKVTSTKKLFFAIK